MNYNDTTDKMLFSELEQHDGVVDINYDKQKSYGSFRIYGVEFKNERIIDDILNKELEKMRNYTHIPVDVNIELPDTPVENTIFIKLS